MDTTDSVVVVEGLSVGTELVLKSFLRTTRAGLLGTGLDVVVEVVVVVIVPDRMAGRVRFLKKGTGVLLTGGRVVDVVVCLSRGLVRTLET